MLHARHEVRLVSLTRYYTTGVFLPIFTLHFIHQWCMISGMNSTAPAPYWSRPAAQRLDQQRRAIVRRGVRVQASWKTKIEVVR